ncbi:MAG: hypothetical protein AAFR21_05285 [Pseudomonadota bacterium]
MKSQTIFLMILASLAVFGCNVTPNTSEPKTKVAAKELKATALPTDTIPTLRPIGKRGFFVLDGPFTEFDPTHPSVELWIPDGNKRAPIVVYAHGGAGFRADDRARVEMFRKNGFATLSFDSYSMNGFEDWEFVTRKVANSGKQSMIWGVYKGALKYASTSGDWDNRNIIMYGGSNGGRVILYAASQIHSENIRAIVSEAPAGSGFALGDYNVPTIIPFGALDTWAGNSDTDYVWKRTYPGSPVSLEDWVLLQQGRGRPIKFVFYENAGHLIFDGPLEKVTVRRGDKIAFTAYQGAEDGVLEQYENDVIAFARENLIP